MGWASGSCVAEPLIKAAKKYVPAAKRPEFYRILLDTLRNHDWDCEEDVRGIDPLFDKLLDESW
jgi:hypothetical protein